MKTMRNLIIGMMIGFVAPAGAALISRIYNFTDGSVLTASQLNTEFNNVVNGVNGIDNSNIAVGANIDPVKINGSIAGAGLARNGSTGILSVTTDDVGIEVTGDSLNLKNLGVTTARIADDAVTAAKLATDVVDDSTLEHNNGTLRIKDLGVVTGKINDLAVTTAKLANGSVTQEKRASLGQQISASSGDHSGCGDVPNLSVTITTTGRPVFIGVIPDGSTNLAMLRATGGGPFSSETISVQIIRDSTVIATAVHREVSTSTDISSVNVIPSIFTIDAPTTGTYTYKISLASAAVPVSVPVCELDYSKIVAYEL